jgi:hypothetical protein
VHLVKLGLHIALQHELHAMRVAGKSVRKYTLRHYSFFFKEIEAKSAEFSTPS